MTTGAGRVFVLHRWVCSVLSTRSATALNVTLAGKITALQRERYVQSAKLFTPDFSSILPARQQRVRPEAHHG